MLGGAILYFEGWYLPFGMASASEMGMEACMLVETMWVGAFGVVLEEEGPDSGDDDMEDIALMWLVAFRGSYWKGWGL